MAWYLSPSGWPTQAVDGSLFADSLAARGWAPLNEADVQAAIDAYNADTPLTPTGPDYLTEAEAATAIAGTGPLGAALRAASGPLGDLRAFNIYQPHNYGAVGDGVADDTAEIVAMLVAGAGERVVFPAGYTYAISAVLTPADGTHIFGLGATIVARNATGSLDSAGRHFDLTNDDITIEGLTFGAPATVLGLGSAEDAVVHSTGARNAVVRCRFEQTGIDAAVFVKGVPAVDNLIDDNHVDGSRIIYSYAGASRTTCRGNRVYNAPDRALNGISNGGPGVWNTDCLVADNLLVDCLGMGIEDNGWATIVRGNRIINAGDMGISAVGVLALVDGNTVIDTDETGVEIGSNGARVVNNTLIGPAGTTHAGISINGHHTGSPHRGATIVGNHVAGWGDCISAQSSEYWTVTITGNVIQDWSSKGVSFGPNGDGGKITGNLFIQTQPRPAATTRFAVSLENRATVSGNDFLYSAGTAGAVNGYDIALRPAPGSDNSQFFGNLIDGGGVTSPYPVEAVATNGAAPAGVVIFGNTATGSAQFNFGFMVNPITFANVGANPPTVTGSRGGNAALASLLTALDTMGFINDTTS